jgi:hypothetical protein
MILAARSNPLEFRYLLKAPVRHNLLHVSITNIVVPEIGTVRNMEPVVGMWIGHDTSSHHC